MSDEVPTSPVVTTQATQPPQNPYPAANLSTSSGDVSSKVSPQVITPVKLPSEVKDVPSELNRQVKGALEAAEYVGGVDSGENLIAILNQALKQAVIEGLQRKRKMIFSTSGIGSPEVTRQRCRKYRSPLFYTMHPHAS